MAQRVMLIKAPSAITLSEGGALRPIALDPAVYTPVIDSLADGQIRSLAELSARLLTLSFGQLLEAVMVMTGRGDLVLAQDDATIAQAKPCTTRLNQHVIASSVQSSQLHCLASPVSGGSVLVQPFHLQILAARRRGLSTVAQWAAFLQNDLVTKGAGVTKPDDSLMSKEESLAALTEMAQTFAHARLPCLQALQTVE